MTKVDNKKQGQKAENSPAAHQFRANKNLLLRDNAKNQSGLKDYFQLCILKICQNEKTFLHQNSKINDAIFWIPCLL